MKKFKFNLFFILSLIGLFTFTACDKDDSEKFVGSIEIGSDEPNVIAKFKIPEGKTVDKVIITGTLLEYEDADIVSGAVIIKPFSIQRTSVTGNVRIGNPPMMVRGEPVPGAEVFADQSDDDPPVSHTETDVDNGNFTIIINNPKSGGFYEIKCTPINSKGGFAIGGFKAT